MTATYPKGRQGNMVVHSVGKDGAPTGEWHFWFFCPGCDNAHVFYVPRWTFHGDFASPTFSPSLLNRVPDVSICHLFLRAGKLEFLHDCTHALAGQTVPLPEPPEWLL